MKKVYLSKAVWGENYLFSEKQNANPCDREQFNGYQNLIEYLSSKDMKELRKRNNVEMHVSGMDADSIKSLEKDLEKIGFKGEIVSD